MADEPAGSRQQEHPVGFDVEYPDRQLNRLTTGFRLVLVIPIVLLLSTLSGTPQQFGTYDKGGTVVVVGGGLLFLPPLLMLLFRHKYPGWWFDWNRELLAFTNRVAAYIALLDDRYPATDDEQAVRLRLPRPSGPELNRWLPLVKWLLAIPHYIVLFFLDIGAVVAVVVAWFAILFIGRYPQNLFSYVVGVLRWHNRVTAYAWILITDRYPPFQLRP